MAVTDGDVRLAVGSASDLPVIRSVALGQALMWRAPGRRVSDEQMLRMRERRLLDIERALETGHLRIYKACERSGDISGFVLVRLAFENSITREFEAHLEDIYVRPDARGRGVGTRLLARAERFVRSKGLRYLVVEVLAHHLPLLAFLERRGYREELKVVMLRDFAIRQRQHPGFLVRPATVLDFRRIKSLSLEMIPFSKPPDRDVSDEMLRELFALQMYDPVQARAERNAFYLVVQTPDREFAGFLCAERETDPICGTLQMKLVNIAVRRAFWGRRAAQALVDRFVNLAVEEHLEYITGVIATANRRSHGFFARAYGSRDERRQLVRKL